MTPALRWLQRRSERVFGSIAFWPTLLGVTFVTLALLLRAYSSEAFLNGVAEAAPYLFVRDRTVALSLLTTLIGGIISLMVFSFSMVMVLLSNASANLTPRLLPSLIGSTRHQVVLGFYLGTLLYCIIIAMGFGVSVDGETPPSLAVALAVGFGFTCLALFIYFIHGVSRSIQVGVVLADVHRRTLAGLESAIAHQCKTPGTASFPNLAEWHPLPAWRSGFVQGFSFETLAAFAKTHDTALAVDVEPGAFVVEGEPLLYARMPLPAAALDEDGGPTASLRRGVFFEDGTDADDYYGAGVERTVEVALKALSPGINDPGTATEAIDYLREVFAEASALHPIHTFADEDGATRVHQRLPTWDTLLARHLRALHHYGADDPQTQDALQRLRRSVLYRLQRVDPAALPRARQLFAQHLD